MAIKFIQPPDLTPAGIDVLCTGYPSGYRKLADDWVCEVTGEVTKVTFWVSFLADWAPPFMPMPLTGVHLSVHADIAQGPHGHSCPGPLLWMRDFGTPEFEVTLESSGVTEMFADPAQGQIGVDTQVYRVDCLVPQGERFFQTSGNIYWLDVVLDTSEQGWQPAGWKTSPDGMAPDFAVWTDVPDPDPLPGLWQLLLLPPAGMPGNLSFAIETEPQATTTTTPATTTQPATTTAPAATKYEQLPDETPDGVDILACDDPLVPTSIRVLADDWPCSQRGRLTRIWIWCSYFQDAIPAPPFLGLKLSIHDDVPSGPHGHSCPGTLLWEHVFTPGVNCELVPWTTTAGEWFWEPPTAPEFPGDTMIFRVDCDLAAPGVPEFIQDGSAQNPRVYWLDVMALTTEPGVRFGWKTSQTHWNDAACWTSVNGPEPVDWQAMSYLPPHQLAGIPIDMAFGVESQPMPPATTTAPPATTAPPYTTTPATTAPPYTTPPPDPDTTPHPADTGPGSPNWRIGSTEVLAYANAFLDDDDVIFPGIPPSNRGAYVLRAAAIYLANFQARYHDAGTAFAWGTPQHAARWQELPDL